MKVKLSQMIAGVAVAAGLLFAAPTGAQANPLTTPITTDIGGISEATGFAAGNELASTSAVAEAGDSSTLPSGQGGSDWLLGVWIGGGALVLVGATIAVGASVRRGRNQADV